MRIASWIRSAPVTYAWLFVLLVTTIAQHTLAPGVVDRILGRRSTNLENLSEHPMRAMVGSLFWLDGAYWLPYLIGFTVFLAVAERWLGTGRFVIVGLAGHVLATLASQGLLDLAIGHGRADPSLRDAVDVGVSYFMAAVVGVLAYRLTSWWRWIYAAVVLATVVTPLVVGAPDFTDAGHFAATVIGLALYPITRGRPRLRSPLHWFRR
ncbi:rhomboid-like protein [Gordonia spumicola]|uniref:rhomboid-like protein n=1 Tax=Gordonia spumicola TaxID=589161 RepID=UPI001E5E8638|nr:rhomboid-like protein [Gordonia spumicola]